MKPILMLLAAICLGLQVNASILETATPTFNGSTISIGENDLFVAEVVTKEFNDVLNIDIKTTSEQIIEVEIFNAEGTVVFSDRLSLYGSMYKKIYTEDYPSGSYKVLITCEDQVLENMVVKK